MKKAIFQLETLTCPSCIKKIETTLRKQQGVKSVKVLFNFSKVRAEFEEHLVQASQLEQMIINLGYGVLSVKVS